MREKLINIIVIILVIMLSVGGTTYYFKYYNPETKETINKNVTISETNTINESVDKIYDATVVIEGYQNNSQAGSGSGFIYNVTKDEAYVMTNHHVIDGMNKIEVVTMDGEAREATILGSDEYMDIAVLKFEVDKNQTVAVAETGDSTKMEIGDTVFTVGAPVGTDYMGTVTKGIISGKNRTITVDVNNSSYMTEVLQTDASINPGNSGGPLVNINGEVIGVTSMKLVQNSIEGMGFAIPIEMAMSQVEKLEKGEKIVRPIVGVSLIDPTNAYALYRSDIRIDENITKGTVIAEVERDSVADEAGLEKGDVIVEVDGTEIKNTAHFRYMLYKHDVGDEMEVKYIRDGKEKKVDLKLKDALEE